jgi:hypothetical protein
VLALAGTNVTLGQIVWEGRISSGADDYEQYVPSGDMDSGSSDLEITEEGDPASNQLIGLRFNGVLVPQGANITNAYVQFHVDEVDVPGDNRPGTKFLRGEAVDNAAPFLDVDNDMSSRPTTSAEASWDWPEWLTEHEEGPDQRTSDIAAVIQEIVDRPGWSPGNSLVLIITGSGENTAEAFEGESDAAALLHIEFSTKFASSPTPPDGEMYEDTWASLGWVAGETAVTHDVYLSDNFDDVNDGAAAALQGNQATTSFIVGFPGMPYPDGLAPGTTYYWRIDEVEADGVTKYVGPVWSFWIPPRTAYNPNPVDDARFVALNADLSWTAGFNAKLHTVYFGDNFDDVNNAVGGIPQIFTTYTPGTLELDKTYYWRVDESDPPATHKGNVWSFKTLPDIPITDPNLVGWWKFEAGAGTTAIDFSGHGNHGTIVDNVQWVPGQFNLALEFLGDNQGHVELPANMVTTAKGSVTMWVNTDLTDDEGMFWYGTETGGDGFGDQLEIHIHIDDPGVLGFAIEGGTDVRLDGPQLAGVGWIHVAVTWDLTDGCRLYANGEQVDFAGHNNTVADLNTIRLGRPVDTGNGNRYHDGLMDDVRLFDHAISAEQVSEIMSKGEDPLRAGSPNPRNSSLVPIGLATPLSWSAGENASEHDVYFGTDKDAVADADETDTTNVYRGRQSNTSHTPTEGVEWGGGPYYWRIDEINTDGTISKGNIWSFTVVDYLIVDDFESYNDINEGEPGSNRIYNAWEDGLVDPAKGGSQTGHIDPPFVERTIVYGGGQSMPLYYDNAGGKSEATLTLTDTRDWTQEGVGVLSLWFQGDTTNAAETMYVVLNGSAVVSHGDPDVALINTWTEWTIDLQAFADQGVNLANVNTITLGFGNRANPVAGGAGMVFFDDIRLVSRD